MKTVRRRLRDLLRGPHRHHQLLRQPDQRLGRRPYLPASRRRMTGPSSRDTPARSGRHRHHSAAGHRGQRPRVQKRPAAQRLGGRSCSARAATAAAAKSFPHRLSTFSAFARLAEFWAWPPPWRRNLPWRRSSAWPRHGRASEALRVSLRLP